MSSAKAGLLAFVLVTPFGLAGYEDFVNDGRPMFGSPAEANETARHGFSGDDYRYREDALRDELLELNAVPEPPDMYDGPLATLVITLGDEPAVLSPAAFDGMEGVDGLEVSAVSEASEAEPKPTGLDLRWSDPDIHSEALLDDAWGHGQERTARSGSEHVFWFNSEVGSSEVTELPVAVRAMFYRGAGGSSAAVFLQLRDVRFNKALISWIGDYLGKPTADIAEHLGMKPTDSPMEFRDSLATEMAIAPTQIQLFHNATKKGSPAGLLQRIVIHTDYAYDRGYVDRLVADLESSPQLGFISADKDEITVADGLVIHTFRRASNAETAAPGHDVSPITTLVIKDSAKDHGLTIELSR